MRPITVSSDIIPIGELKTHLSKYLKEINKKRNSLIITQNGKPAGVLLSPSEFDDLTETKRFIESIAAGLADVENGDVYTHEEVKKMFLIK